MCKSEQGKPQEMLTGKESEKEEEEEEMKNSAADPYLPGAYLELTSGWIMAGLTGKHTYSDKGKKSSEGVSTL